MRRNCEFRILRIEEVTAPNWPLEQFEIRNSHFEILFSVLTFQNRIPSMLEPDWSIERAGQNRRAGIHADTKTNL